MQKVWFNSCIRVGNKPFYVKDYAKAQISQLSDFLHETENRFLTYIEVREKYPFDITQLEYNSLISAIPIEWKRMIKQIRPNIYIYT